MSMYSKLDDFREVFQRTFPNYDPTELLHAVIIQEAWETSNGNAEVAHAALHTLADDCKRFAAAIVVFMPDSTD